MFRSTARRRQAPAAGVGRQHSVRPRAPPGAPRSRGPRSASRSRGVACSRCAKAARRSGFADRADAAYGDGGEVRPLVAGAVGRRSWSAGSGRRAAAGRPGTPSASTGGPRSGRWRGSSGSGRAGARTRGRPGRRGTVPRRRHAAGPPRPARRRPARRTAPGGPRRDPAPGAVGYGEARRDEPVREPPYRVRAGRGRPHRRDPGLSLRPDRADHRALHLVAPARVDDGRPAGVGEQQPSLPGHRHQREIGDPRPVRRTGTRPRTASGPSASAGPRPASAAAAWTAARHSRVHAVPAAIQASSRRKDPEHAAVLCEGCRGAMGCSRYGRSVAGM